MASLWSREIRARFCKDSDDTARQPSVPGGDEGALFNCESNGGRFKVSIRLKSLGDGPGKGEGLHLKPLD